MDGRTDEWTNDKAEVFKCTFYSGTHYFCCLEQAWSHLLSVNLKDLELQQFWERGIRESLKSRVNQVGFPGLLLSH